jgi:hypothetical protein
MKKLKTEDLIEIVDYWFKKTYGKSVMELSEEERMSKDFYSKYPVTQELHDEWVEWAKDYIKAKLKCSKKYLERGWGWVYLQIAPAIK